MDAIRALMRAALLRAKVERLIQIIDDVSKPAGLRREAERMMSSTLDRAEKIEKEHLR